MFFTLDNRHYKLYNWKISRHTSKATVNAIVLIAYIQRCKPIAEAIVPLKPRERTSRAAWNVLSEEIKAFLYLPSPLHGNFSLYHWESLLFWLFNCHFVVWSNFVVSRQTLLPSFSLSPWSRHSSRDFYIHANVARAPTFFAGLCSVCFCF